jgi:hypothetical protein
LAAAERRQAATYLERRSAELGLPRDVAPGPAIIEALGEARGQADWFLQAAVQAQAKGDKANVTIATAKYEYWLREVVAYGATAIKGGLEIAQAGVLAVQYEMLRRVLDETINDGTTSLSAGQRDELRSAAVRHLRALASPPVPSVEPPRPA